MPDKDVFLEATRLEDWTHLAGDGAAARAKSVSLRRARYAGFAGATAATAAVAVGVVAIAGTFGGSRSSAAVAGTPAGHTPAKVTVTSPPTSPTSPPTSPVSQAPAKGTMGALFEQWKSCPDSELTVVNTLPQDPSHLQQNWRDACRRDVATLSALLPDYEVTPAVAGVGEPKGTKPGDSLTPYAFEDPEFVIPAGYTPHMGTAIYRIVNKAGDTSKVYIHALNRVDGSKPATGEAVTLPNGLQAWLTLGTNLADGRPGYEIYVLNKGYTFYMLTTAQPNFDFKTLVTSPQFADMVAKALAEPEG